MRGLHFCPLALKQGSVIGLASSPRMGVNSTFNCQHDTQYSLHLPHGPGEPRVLDNTITGWWSFHQPLHAGLQGELPERMMTHTWKQTLTAQTISVCEATEICGSESLQHDPALLTPKPACKSHSEGARVRVLTGEWEQSQGMRWGGTIRTERKAEQRRRGLQQPGKVGNSK